MKVSAFISRAIPYSILLITVSSVNAWTSIHLGNTFFWWLLYAFILYLFYKGQKIFGRHFTEKAWPISLFIGVVVISFGYGCVMAEYYWDWKLLIGNLLVFLLPLAVYPFGSPIILARTFRVWFRYAPLFFPVFLLVLHSEAYGRYLVPISIILLFFAKLPLKWKFIGIGTLVFILVSSIDARSNVIKIIIPFVIGLLYYFKNWWTSKVRRKLFYAITLVLLGSPFVFFSLAASNTFNVFNMSDYLAKWSNVSVMETGEGESISLLDDTRTQIYQEEISSSINNNYWLFGRSMARGYDSESFGSGYQEENVETNRLERFSSEVSILNIFNYFGLIGVFSYFLIFVVASYNAVFKSNSIYMSMIGVYVAFRWMYAWVEDFNLFDLNYLFLWIMIGMCFSRPFKAMNDIQFNNWIQSLFSTSKRRINPGYSQSMAGLKVQEEAIMGHKLV
jgi:hypothetical protein